jgi:hypothetical protein
MAINSRFRGIRRTAWLAWSAAFLGLLAVIMPGAAPAQAYASCNLKFYYNIDGSAAWPAEQIATRSSCFIPPAIARETGATDVSAISDDSTVLRVYLNFDGSGTWPTFWSLPVSDPGGGISGTLGGQTMINYNGGSSFGGGFDVAAIMPTASWTPPGSLLFCPTNGVKSGAACDVPASGLSASPSIAYAPNATEMAATGSDGSLWFYWEYNGTSAWNPDRVAGPGSTSGSPSILTYNGGTEIAATGPGGNVWFYWIINGTSTWHAVPIAGTGSASAAPALFDSGGTTEFAYTGTDGSLWFFWVTDGTSNWGGARIAGPGSASGSPALVVSSTATELAARRGDGSLWFYWAYNGTSTWHSEQVAGPGTTDSTPVMTRSAGATEIAVAGP